MWEVQKKNEIKKNYTMKYNRVTFPYQQHNLRKMCDFLMKGIQNNVNGISLL